MTILLLLLLIGCGYSYFLYPLLLRALLRHPPPQGEEPAELPRLFFDAFFCFGFSSTSSKIEISSP